MKWYEFKCEKCFKVKNSKKCLHDYKIGYRFQSGYCNDCFALGCDICRKPFYMKIYKYNENRCCNSCFKILKQKQKGFSYIYLAYSKKLNLFKIGETKQLLKDRLSSIKRDKHQSDDWIFLVTYEIIENPRLHYVIRKAFERILRERYYEHIHSYYDYFTDIDIEDFKNTCKQLFDLIEKR